MREFKWPSSITFGGIRGSCHVHRDCAAFFDFERSLSDAVTLYTLNASESACHDRLRASRVLEIVPTIPSILSKIYPARELKPAGRIGDDFFGKNKTETC